MRALIRHDSYSKPFGTHRNGALWQRNIQTCMGIWAYAVAKAMLPWSRKQATANLQVQLLKVAKTKLVHGTNSVLADGACIRSALRDMLQRVSSNRTVLLAA